MIHNLPWKLKERMLSDEQMKALGLTSSKIELICDADGKVAVFDLQMSRSRKEFIVEACNKYAQGAIT